MIQVADQYTLSDLGSSLQVTEVLISLSPDNLQAEMLDCLIDSIGSHVVIKVVDDGQVNAIQKEDTTEWL